MCFQSVPLIFLSSVFEMHLMQYAKYANQDQWTKAWIDRYILLSVSDRNSSLTGLNIMYWQTFVPAGC